MQSILGENVEKFVAYGFYTERVEDVSPERRRQIAKFISRVEAWDVHFPEGRNPDITFHVHVVRHTLARTHATRGISIVAICAVTQFIIPRPWAACGPKESTPTTRVGSNG